MSSHNGSSLCAFPRTCSTPVPVPPGCRTDMTISKPSLIPIEAVGIKKAAASAQTIQPSTTRPAPMIADHSPAQICTGERALRSPRRDAEATVAARRVTALKEICAEVAGD
jgi:hypothetical protein